MVIELRQEPDHQFKFKIGDNVRFKIGVTAGAVIASYRSSDQIYYMVKIPEGVMKYAENDIEFVLEEKAVLGGGT